MIAANLHLGKKEDLKQKYKDVSAGRKGRYGTEMVCKERSEVQIIDFLKEKITKLKKKSNNLIII